MDLKDAKDEAADADELCGAVCPFGIKYCMNMCVGLMEAIGSSTKFPCEVTGMCPTLDEDGAEVDCQYYMGKVFFLIFEHIRQPSEGRSQP